MTSKYDLRISYHNDDNELESIGFPIDWHQDGSLRIINKRPEFSGASPTSDYSVRDAAPPYPFYYSSWTGGSGQDNGDSSESSENKYKDSYCVDVRDGSIVLAPLSLALMDCKELTPDMPVDSVYPSDGWVDETANITSYEEYFKLISNDTNLVPMQESDAMSVIPGMKYTISGSIGVSGYDSGYIYVRIYWYEDATKAAAGPGNEITYVYLNSGVVAANLTQENYSKILTAPPNANYVSWVFGWYDASAGASQNLYVGALSLKLTGFHNLTHEFDGDLYLSSEPNSYDPRDTVWRVTKGALRATTTSLTSLGLHWTYTYDIIGSGVTADTWNNTTDPCIVSYPSHLLEIGNYLKLLDYSDPEWGPDYEIVKVVGVIDDDTVAIARGRCGTTPSAHSMAKIYVDRHTRVALDLYDPNEELTAGCFLFDPERGEMCRVTEAVYDDGITEARVERAVAGTLPEEHSPGVVWHYYKFTPITFSGTDPSQPCSAMAASSYGLYTAFSTKDATTADGSLWYLDTNNDSFLTQLGTNPGIRELAWASGIVYAVRENAGPAASNDLQAGYFNDSWVFQNIAGSTLVAEYYKARTIGMVALDEFVYFGVCGATRTNIYQLQHLASPGTDTFKCIAHLPPGFVGTSMYAAYGNIYIGGYYDSGEYHIADRTAKIYLGAVYVIVGPSSSSSGSLALLTTVGRDSTTEVIDNRVAGMDVSGNYLYISTRDDIFVWDLKRAALVHHMDFPTGSVAQLYSLLSSTTESGFNYVYGITGYSKIWQDISTVLKAATDPTTVNWTRYDAGDPPLESTDVYGTRVLEDRAATGFLSSSYVKTATAYADGVTATFALPKYCLTPQVYPAPLPTVAAVPPPRKIGHFGVCVNGRMVELFIVQPLLADGTATRDYKLMLLTTTGTLYKPATWYETTINGANAHSVRISADNRAFTVSIDGANQFGGFMSSLPLAYSLDSAYSRTMGTIDNCVFFGVGDTGITSLRSDTATTLSDRVWFGDVAVADGYYASNPTYGMIPVPYSVTTTSSESLWLSYEVRNINIYNGDIWMPVPGRTLVLGLAKTNAAIGYIDTSDTTLKQGAVDKSFSNIEVTHSPLKRGQFISAIATIDDKQYDCGYIGVDNQSIGTSRLSIGGGGVVGKRISVRLTLYDDDSARDRPDRLHIRGITIRFVPVSEKQQWSMILDLTGARLIRDTTKYDVDPADAIERLVDLARYGTVAQYEVVGSTAFDGIIENLDIYQLPPTDVDDIRGRVALTVREA